MSKIKALLANYKQYIAIPWRQDAAAAQRVIFCVYNEIEERILRVQIDEFEIATKGTGHEWALFDLTDTFAVWLSSLKYVENYLRQPEKLDDVFPEYLSWLINKFKEFIDEKKISSDHVIALSGVGSLFGILKIKEVVDTFAPMFSGKLLVFFPGSFENNNYRLLDSYDGWNYLAVPITADKGQALC
jgi:hypothetical protein